jgi:C4-dicarboxylate-specific signal transduction histidine kinase
MHKNFNKPQHIRHEDAGVLAGSDRTLDRKELLFDRVQRMAKIGIWELDIRQNRLAWSEEVFRIFEIMPERFEPSYDFLISVIHPEDREAFNAAYLYSLEIKAPFTLEHRLLMPDGRIKYLREECETAFDARGKPVTSYGTVQDITALKTMEAEKEAQRQMLLQQNRLAQMGKMIDTIVHQWKQPLYQINSILPALERDYTLRTLSAEQLGARLDEIEMLTTHLAHTVESFRHFFHPRDSGTKFNVSEAVKGALALVKSEMDQLKVSCEFQSKERYEAVGNKEEFMQALLSIFYNAAECFKHRHIVDPKLRIDLYPSERGFDIAISDNAGGIPDQSIDKIFDLYFTTKINGHGTGLGLYIAKMLIEKSMHGTITAHNGEEGAVFAISLPCGG